MVFKRETLALRGDTPGTSTELTFYRIGPAAAPETAAASSARE